MCFDVRADATVRLSPPRILSFKFQIKYEDESHMYLCICLPFLVPCGPVNCQPIERLGSELAHCPTGAGAAPRADKENVQTDLTINLQNTD